MPDIRIVTVGTMRVGRVGGVKTFDQVSMIIATVITVPPQWGVGSGVVTVVG